MMYVYDYRVMPTSQILYDRYTGQATSKQRADHGSRMYTETVFLPQHNSHCAISITAAIMA